MSDLDILFGGLNETPVLKGPGLVEDLGVTVELLPGVEHTFPSISDARAVLSVVRPRRLPRISKYRPVHYWLELDAGQWKVIEYGLMGEITRGTFGTVLEAWQRLITLRKTAKTGVLSPYITEL